MIATSRTVNVLVEPLRSEERRLTLLCHTL